VLDREQELIGQAQRANTDAFCALAEGYERRIYSLAFHYCHDSEDAEDLSQEVWLRAYQAIGSFRGESSFYTWLRRITINCFLNHRRARSFGRHGQSVELSTQDLVPNTIEASGISSERTMHDRILLDKVRQALSELTTQQRLIFVLKHYEGMTYEEISEAVGCSMGTAKKSVSRAIAKLRKRLDVAVETNECVPCAASEF
jgi:RNA polymerase sigma-70 factor (ECF subfamily)